MTIGDHHHSLNGVSDRVIALPIRSSKSNTVVVSLAGFALPAFMREFAPKLQRERDSLPGARLGSSTTIVDLSKAPVAP
jgi:hypothetical protein